MRNHRLPRYTVFVGVAVASALTLALSLTWSVPTALAAGPANANRDDAMGAPGAIICAGGDGRADTSSDISVA